MKEEAGANTANRNRERTFGARSVCKSKTMSPRDVSNSTDMLAPPAAGDKSLSVFVFLLYTKFTSLRTLDRPGKGEACVVC